MARRERSKPVSEKEAGNEKEKSDELAELLDGADAPETPPAAEPDVEAVESGPAAQPMPGSASDREAKAEPTKPPSAPSDLRKLAPKKSAAARRDPGKYQINAGAGANAIAKVLDRGVDQGDTSKIEPVEIHRVKKGGRVMINGQLCTISAGARVTRLTHDLQNLKLQGIELEVIDRQ